MWRRACAGAWGRSRRLQSRLTTPFGCAAGRFSTSRASSMHALTLTGYSWSEGGTRGRLRYESVEQPACGANEVLVRTHLACVNRLDTRMSEPLGYGRTLMGRADARTRRVLGREGAGVVVSVGSAVWDVEPGDYVLLGLSPMRAYGAFGEFCVAGADEMVRVPDMVLRALCGDSRSSGPVPYAPCRFDLHNESALPALKGMSSLPFGFATAMSAVRPFLQQEAGLLADWIGATPEEPDARQRMSHELVDHFHHSAAPQPTGSSVCDLVGKTRYLRTVGSPVRLAGATEGASEAHFAVHDALNKGVEALGVSEIHQGLRSAEQLSSRWSDGVRLLGQFAQAGLSVAAALPRVASKLVETRDSNQPPSQPQSQQTSRTEPSTRDPEMAFPGTVFVHGGSGAVGRLVCAMLSSLGYEVVASCSTATRKVCVEAGCSRTLDYRRFFLQEEEEEEREDENSQGEGKSADAEDQDAASQCLPKPLREYLGRVALVVDCVGNGFDLGLPFMLQGQRSAQNPARYVSLNSPVLMNMDAHGPVEGLFQSRNDFKRQSDMVALCARLAATERTGTEATAHTAVDWAFADPQKRDMELLGRLLGFEQDAWSVGESALKWVVDDGRFRFTPVEEKQGKAGKSRKHSSAGPRGTKAEETEAHEGGRSGVDAYQEFVNDMAMRGERRHAPSGRRRRIAKGDLLQALRYAENGGGGGAGKVCVEMWGAQ